MEKIKKQYKKIAIVFLAALDILILFIAKSGWISFKVDGITRAVWLILQADIWIILLFMLRKERQSTRKLYFTDTLTRGYNRNGFIQAASKLLALEDCGHYVIVNLNIHDFKSINYQLGEKKANQLLVKIYQEMKECIQKEELVCRSEMDRFLLFLHKASDESVCSTLKQIIEKVQKMNPDILLNFTVGACRLSEGEKLQDTIHKASCMMTSSQSQNRCIFYDEEIQRQQKEEEELLYSFDQSIKDKDFLIFLQPVVSTSRNRCLNAEALVRWKHPHKGLLFPNQFIPLFELHNKIAQLDLYMFEAVCEIAERWSLNSGTFIEISVNLSRRHLKQKGLRICKDYRQIKDRYKIPDGMIKLEITENTMFELADISMVGRIIDEFHKMGLKVGLDDFGFAYSSVELLKEFDIDVLKLDRSFFMNENAKSRTIVKKLIELSHDLEITVVAEGIEEKTQVNALAEMNCDYIQGYFYSKPLPVDGFEEWRAAYGQQKH